MRKEAVWRLEKKDVYWVLDVFSQKSTGAQTRKRSKTMGYAMSRWRLLCVWGKINGREKNVQILLWQTSTNFYRKFGKSGWHWRKSVIKSKWVIRQVCFLLFPFSFAPPFCCRARPTRKYRAFYMRRVANRWTQLTTATPYKMKCANLVGKDCYLLSKGGGL